MPRDTSTASLTWSALDSARFGLNIARATSNEISPKTLAAELLGSSIDVAILRLPAGAPSGIDTLKNWGLPVVHADTLVYYACDLTTYTPQPLRNASLDFSLAADEDAAELETLVRSTFASYRSHYHANRLFPPDQILAGYQEWAQRHLRSDDGHCLWVARRDRRIVAFAACRRIDAQTFEGVLYGVAPGAAGGGLYGDLIRHTQAVAKATGAHTMKVSTQVNNFAVQKVWAREGFHLFEAWDTFHINSLREAGETIYRGSIEFSERSIREFAALTGDDNPLHLDLATARAKGLPGPIAHGVMTLGEMSRVLGTRCPGPGTVILHADTTYLKPIVAGHAYRLQMRAPTGISTQAPFEIVADVYGDDDELRVVVRFEVLKRA
jgi:hypothetical protein